MLKPLPGSHWKAILPPVIPMRSPLTGSTITITDEGTYVISGTLENCLLMVDAEDTDKVQIVLNNASITNETSAALYVREADKVFLTTAPDSETACPAGTVMSP